MSGVENRVATRKALEELDPTLSSGGEPDLVLPLAVVWVIFEVDNPANAVRGEEISAIIHLGLNYVKIPQHLRVRHLSERVRVRHEIESQPWAIWDDIQTRGCLAQVPSLKLNTRRGIQ